MDILHKDNGEKGAFYIEAEGKMVAEMTYVWAGHSRLIIDHTTVGDELKGKGAGKQLLAKVVAFARDQGVKIVPLCPFAKSVFEKMPEYGDVLA